jgi:hypothetical protein
MKRLLFVSLALFGSINAAESARKFTIDVPREKVGFPRRHQIDLTIAGPERKVIKEHLSRRWKEKRGNITIYGLWQHGALVPLASGAPGPAPEIGNTIECVQERGPEGNNKYECMPSTENDQNKFKELEGEFQEIVSGKVLPLPWPHTPGGFW